ncbi:glycerophosphodiester phosphodiesterase family protein [Altericroceibacterium endophyticum]|uniref:Glycerophosphodiester phosphodiesterase n=1 Tax=Altericroceibacterium endophyticum TaxID=1808508 RepID=A0A6I4T2F2_9SPHN|nr:glycerophosphodiester phosphodiesterase family protein [Altericroceibacterium endophyticum]MXO64309.1 glycerophosphodiester phosphodiesterase [Altericroceibacterium endophyticum]
MMKTTMTITGAMLLALAATPALASPVCGDTARMAQLQAEWHDPTGPLLIASHRGGHLNAPENSLAAVDEAVANGADVLEIDVRVSRDGVPFIMHDSTVDRTTNGEGVAEDMTYAELRGLRLAGGTTPPPSLIEMLRHSCGRILVDLDMKTDRVGPVIAVVEGLGMVDQVMVFDSDSDTLRRARSLLPTVSVMTRLRPDSTLAEKNRGLFPIAIVHGDTETLDPATSEAIAAIPARIWANALGDIDRLLPDGAAACPALADLEQRGVSVIQTDFPRLLRARLATCRAEAGEGVKD